MKKILLFTTALIVLIILVSSSCTKKKDSTEDITNNDPSGTYAVGHISNGGTYIATLWHNSTKQSLSNGTTDVYANAVFVSANNDVYVVGDSLLDDNTPFAILWKNGKRTVLGTADSKANSVFVSGNDVYVVGEAMNGTKKQAALWKNNDAVQYLTDGIRSTSANSVYVVGTDVYVVGNTDRILGYNTGAFWKNGTLTIIGDAGKGANTNSVFVSNGKVYIAGNDKLYSLYTPTYWVDGIPNDLFLKTSSYKTYCNSLFVSNKSDVYACGYYYSSTTELEGIYWKNGYTNQVSNSSVLYGIYVVESDVYVGGVNKNSKPTLWKNGIEQVLDQMQGNVLGIFVK